MADFQTSVNLYAAKGIPGGTASINPILSAPFNYHAGKKVKIGTFVWLDGTDKTKVNGTTSTSTELPIGFAHLDRIYTAPDVTAGPTLAVPEGATVEVVTGGDFYATATAAVTAGQAVYVDTATGNLYGATKSGYVKTGFVWAEDAAAGEIGVISTNYPEAAGGVGG